MKIKTLHLITYSPTKTGLKNIEFASQSFEYPIIIHDITKTEIEYAFTNEDLVMIVAPVYSGRIPNIASERIHKFNGNKTPCILFVTYGNREFDDALKELDIITRFQGFKPIAALAVIGEHTFTDKVATNRPDSIDQKSLATDMELIKEKIALIENIDDINILSIPGKIPNKIPKRLALAPITNENCIHCNLCLEACPTHAITLETFDIPSDDLCNSCLACVKVCPTNSRHANYVKISSIAKTIELSCSKRKEISLFI